MARLEPQASMTPNQPPDNGATIPTLYDETFRCVPQNAPDSKHG